MSKNETAETARVEVPVSMDPAGALKKAQALEQAGRIAEAEPIYRALLRAYPNHAALTYNLALAVKALGQSVEAESLLRRAIVLEPGEAVLHNALGNILCDQGKFEAARACYAQAIALKPYYVDAHYNLGTSHEAEGRPRDAIDAYERTLSIQPDCVQALARIGALMYMNKLFANALPYLDKAVALRPDHFGAQYHRGCVLAELQRYDEALTAWHLADALRPRNFETALAIANTLQLIGRNDDALAALWDLVEKRPKRIETHYQLNSLAWATGRKDVFLKSFAYAREREGEDPDLLLHEAGFRSRLDENEEAERLLRRARELAPERADIAGLLGRTLAQQRKFADSYAFYDAAIKADPQTTKYRVAFGFALLSDHQPREALRVLEEARAADAFDQLALAGLCLAYRELGDSRYSVLADIANHVRVYDIKVPRGFADARAFNNALAQELQKFHSSTVEPIDQSLRGGTQTLGDLFDQKSIFVQQVRDTITEAVADYVRSLPDDPTHPLSARKAENFTYSGSWSCQLRSSGYHANHVHPSGWISSAYYVHLPHGIDEALDHQGWLKFAESNLALGARDQAEHLVKPIVGRLVLFPSYFWHGTVPFTADDTRLGIAFDVVPGAAPSATPEKGRA